MIDNIELIKPLLTFTPDDFYMLYVLKRKKDQPEGEKENSQSVRTIKTYGITSFEYLEQRYDEIKTLCELFKARAYIHLSSQNHNKIGLLMMERLAQRLRNGVINQKDLFDSIVGELHGNEKRWIIDIDTQDVNVIKTVKDDITHLCRPYGVNKLITTIPTRNGVHLITSRFSTEDFEAYHADIEVQKHNPTLLYLPDSLK